MIKSGLSKLRFEASEKQGRKLTIQIMVRETGLSYGTIQRLLSNDLDRVEFRTLDVLCKYFQCDVGDILIYSADPARPPQI